jgi:hypothetical protein
MRAIGKVIASMAAGLLWPGLAHADICADMRAIHAQAQSHFDGWKKDRGQGAYGAAFMLDGAADCSIGADSNGYSCVWKFATPVDMGRAYVRMVDEIKACPPLLKEQPAILNEKPDDRSQGDLRRSMEVTGFDYADAEVTVLVGQMQLTGAKAGLARNELKFSFIKAAAHN